MPNWYKVAKISDLKIGEGKTVDIHGKPIALFNNGGTFQAIDNTCPHRGGSLGEGKLKENCVVCPLHQWTFNLETGQNIRNTAVKLNVYPTKIEGEEVWIEI
ncbi:MAG: hypothetical protein A2W61_00640 [Deltaproteobacteria bacterium RIFCSPLOWO2_01_44_7]|nr:MAG: hypothetical protein A2712_05990 [Deltaproteobacteria bacterium RIFCSPHIGHO2_01_FULL_43_49]OGQ16681.1 MAG: hypothetical protein A3D22_07115 [Deltaproteobacteria bacterium RIFCSPHIGHO2_02_FULL_44_53]OGQ29819.1 MAG: hypothetical protein A3D98_09780 [Deltaproteobacteria bacterium RIFCSPHIGHO2_12_FULL_44_21]OGQ33109.1 MAG: hypothetical protein A2979_03760 [Deltaproteobacteria bacterium RIFCSPLOWO2_01_FULL_45_74]OGQ39604.1 MAG: hypothetical protein A2W61_00640 [Deltaproteobacteria bacterium 